MASKKQKTSGCLNTVSNYFGKENEQGSAHHITELGVSLDSSTERNLQAQGFVQIPADLNKGAKGNYVYVWFRRGGGPGITRIQTSFNDEMAHGLIFAGYQKINVNLNAGARGDYIYLWSYKGSSEYDVPIVHVHVSTEPEEEAQLFQSGWERIGCDLNRKSKGKFIYLWVKREQPTYICDITATNGFHGDANLLQDGYNRVDEDANRGARGGWIYIWYRQTSNCHRAIQDLQVSITECESQSFQHEGYTAVIQDLNQGAGGNYVFLWFRKNVPYRNPIKTVSVMVNTGAVQAFKNAGIQVIEKDLNKGNSGDTLYVCFSQ